MNFLSSQIGTAINSYGRGLCWASHGMMRMEVKVMKRLFRKAIDRIVEVSDGIRKMGMIYLINNRG